MEQEIVLPGHGVLVIAEAGQGVVQEMLKGVPGLAFGDREPERLQIAEPVRPGFRYLLDDPAGGGVRLETQRARQRAAAVVALAVVGVEVPAAAHRFTVRFHQQAGVAAHFPVEELHAQLLTARGPAPERLGGAQETAVLEQPHRQAQPLRPAPFHGLAQAVLAGLGDQQFAGVQLPGAGQHRFAQILQALVQGVVVHAPALAAQARGEMAHGAEQERQLLAVVGHVAGFLAHLGHDHAIAGRVAFGQAAEMGAELVAENQYQAGCGHGGGPCAMG